MAFNLQGQEFLGLNKQEIIGNMKKSYPSFKINDNFENNYYDYLKFENRIDEATVLFFFDKKDSKCNVIRVMYDYSNINDTNKLLNKKYKKTAKKTWEGISRFNNKKITINLEEGEWFFTVTYKYQN